eukprot:8715737-Pyramimonas_sp.AAC.1
MHSCLTVDDGRNRRAEPRSPRSQPAREQWMLRGGKTKTQKPTSLLGGRARGGNRGAGGRDRRGPRAPEIHAEFPRKVKCAEYEG